MQVVNRIGQRFGRLVVVRRAENDKSGRAQWLCRCDCGGEKVVKNGNLRDGITSSCGCFRSQRAARLGRQMHGSNSPVWKGGYDGAYCRCQRSLAETKKKAKKYGYASCTATIEELLPTVANKCQLCGAPEMEMTKRLCLDHNHETGEFRGWLCDHCNRVVGYIETHAERVFEYLTRRKLQGETVNDRH